MTTYTCKCGKTFEGKGDSVTTGMRVPRADYTVDHFCFGCPFMKDVNVDSLECRGTRETPVYGTTASCVSSKASTLHVSSLDFDFIQDMSDFYNSLAVVPPKSPPTPSMEGGSGRYPFSFDFPKNNKGEKAKRELIEHFFEPVQGEESYREMFARKDISGFAEECSLYDKIEKAKEEAKSMSIQTETTAFVGTMYRHVGRVLHIGPSEEKFRTFFYFLEDPSDEIFLGALPKCDTPEIAQKMLDDYAARHDYEVYEPTSEAESPLTSDLSSDNTPAEAAGEPEDNEPATQPEQDDAPDYEGFYDYCGDPSNSQNLNETPDSENDLAESDNKSCDWKNASGADEDEDEGEVVVDESQEREISGVALSLQDDIFLEMMAKANASLCELAGSLIIGRQREGDVTIKLTLLNDNGNLDFKYAVTGVPKPTKVTRKGESYESIQIVIDKYGNPMIPYDREHQINFDEIQPGRMIPPTPVTTTVDGNTGLVEDVQVEGEPDEVQDTQKSQLAPCGHVDCPFWGNSDIEDSGCCFDSEDPDSMNYAGDVWTAVNMENCQRGAVLEAYRKNNPEDDYDGSDQPNETDDLPLDMQNNYEEDSAS